MNWNDAADDFVNSVLAETPRPLREATESQLRGLAEAMAEEDGKNRVGVETVIAAWVRSHARDPAARSAAPDGEIRSRCRRISPPARIARLTST